MMTPRFIKIPTVSNPRDCLGRCTFAMASVSIKGSVVAVAARRGPPKYQSVEQPCRKNNADKHQEDVKKLVGLCIGLGFHRTTRLGDLNRLRSLSGFHFSYSFKNLAAAKWTVNRSIDRACEVVVERANPVRLGPWIWTRSASRKPQLNGASRTEPPWYWGLVGLSISLVFEDAHGI